MRDLRFLIADFRLLMVGLALGLTACGSSVPEATLSAEMLYTQGAQTVIAAVTQGAQGTQPAPTNPIGQVTQPAGATLPAGATQPAATPPPSFTPTLAPTPTPPPTATPPPTLTTAPQAATPVPTDIPLTVVLEDDFSNPDLWADEQNDDFAFFVEDDALHMTTSLLNASIWTIRGRERADVRVQTDAARQAGPEEGLFGVVCRLVDEDNYYALMISSRGEYLIGKMLDGEFTELAYDAAPAGYVNTGSAGSGGAINQVRGDCFGSTLRLWANGYLLAEVQDTDFAAGQTGLTIRTRLQPGLEVAFDNYKLFEP